MSSSWRSIAIRLSQRSRCTPPYLTGGMGAALSVEGLPLATISMKGCADFVADDGSSRRRLQPTARPGLQPTAGRPPRAVPREGSCYPEWARSGRGLVPELSQRGERVGPGDELVEHRVEGGEAVLAGPQ